MIQDLNKYINLLRYKLSFAYAILYKFAPFMDRNDLKDGVDYIEKLADLLF